MENSSCFCVLERLRTSVVRMKRRKKRLLVMSVITMEPLTCHLVNIRRLYIV